MAHVYRNQSGVPFVGVVVPAVVTGALALAAALPWGVPGSISFLLPLLTFAGIFYWTVRRPKLLPVWFAFLLGLCTDLLTNGPFGFWSLNFVVGHTLATLGAPMRRNGNRFLDWVLFGGVVTLMSFVSLAVATLYFFRPVDWMPVAYSALGAVAVYPFVMLLLSAFDALIATPRYRASQMEAR